MTSPLQVPAQVEVVRSRHIQAHIGKPPPEEMENLFVVESDMPQLGLTASLAALVCSAGHVSANGEGHMMII